MKIRVLIVDDEPLARQRIRLLLASEPDMELTGECASGKEALEFIQENNPDLVFLDVQMPEMDGFALITSLPKEQLPAVIFVTAYDQHAVKAFEVNALDYLLKPFKPARFQQTVQRARERLAKQNKEEVNMQALLEALGRKPAESAYINRLPIKTQDRITFLKIEQVDYIESAGNYVAVLAGKETHIVRETLNTLESQLNPERFLRISRSVIVNLDRVKELQPHFHGEHFVVLHNGKRFHMTRGLREVEKALKYSQ